MATEPAPIATAITERGSGPWKRIATAAVLIPIVLLVVLRAPVPLLAAVVAVVALLTTHEFLQLSQNYRVQPLWKPTYVYIALLFLFLALNGISGKPLLATASFMVGMGFSAVLAPFVFLVIGMARSDFSTSLPAAAASAFAFAYIALPLGFLVQVRQQWAGAILLVYVLLVVWAGDTTAYFVGRAFGRHRMSPRVSPKKTWEGAVGSMLGSLLLGWAFLAYAQPVSSALLQAHLIQRRDGYFALQPWPLATILMLSAAINVAAQLGDMVESLIKRGAGAKDSGALLPGHGGMLDRIDALLLAAPVIWFYAALRVLS
ncbi:MAG TPA: phosphatidate cytidylyltransferase [Terriglobales bacterium]|nr:phosphatidate cytidylyltransferase [Terriglobales bacterium]